jgi:hypothetical protein
MRAGIDVRRLMALALLGSALAACGGTTPATGSPVPTSAPSATPTSAVQTLQPSAATSATPTAAATSSASPTPLGGGPTGSNPPLSIDPCTLLTTDQASAVNGSAYPAGVSHVMGSGSVECVWQTSTPPSSVVVQVGQFPNVTDAQVAYAKAQALLNGAQLEQLTGFADDAVIARGSGAGMTTGGIYVREGSTFFDVVYLNGTVPTDDQLKYYATLILGELPTGPAGP